jgi:hypothetical protein
MSSSKNFIKTGRVVAINDDKTIVLGFKPRYVVVLNVTQLKTTFKTDVMLDGEAYQRITDGTLSAVDHLDLLSDGFNLKNAAHAVDDVLLYRAHQAENE